jgi:tripartite-type tricarboxylate transporter receptor subunit TctC
MPWLKSRRQKFWHHAATNAVICAVLIAAPSQTALARADTIRLIVPYTPGSGPDILSRLLADEIGRQNGPNLIVENRPGGGTVLGTELVQHADPDGNTLLLVGNSFAINPALKRGNYQIATDFAPICQLASTPIVLVTKADAPYHALGDLIAAARARPGTLAFASGGPASALHVAIEVLRGATGIDVTYVPFGGNAPAVNALLGGHVAAAVADYPTLRPHLKAGTLRALVTTARQRIADLPEVPTLAETGISDYQAQIFYGMLAPAQTPAARRAELVKMLTAALSAPELAPKFAEQGLFPGTICGTAFGASLARLADDYVRIIRQANITAQ